MIDKSEIKNVLRNVDPRIKGYIAELEKQIQTLLRDKGKQDARHHTEIEKLKIEHDNELLELREELGCTLSPEGAYMKIIKNKPSSK
jgi:hypothetical protein